MLARLAIPATLLAFAIAGPVASPATAQVMPREPDAVSLQLNAEEWVETETATVRATVEAAFQGGQSGAVREQVLAALAKTAPEGKWHLTSFDQLADPSGLERWRVVGEARLGEKQLGGIRQRADQASKPGLKVVIASVDFTPTLAEREAVAAKLREKLYADVKAELARLNAVFPDRKYRVRNLSIGTGAVEMQPRFKTMQAPAAASMSVAQDAVSVSQKLVINGSAVLATD